MTRAAGWGAIALIVAATCVVAQPTDAVSREVTVRRGSSSADIASREVVFRRGAPTGDVVSREVTLRLRGSFADAISREVILSLRGPATDAVSREVMVFRSSGRPGAVAREMSLNVAGPATVADGYEIEQSGVVPGGRAEWMSIAAGDDLYVASTRARYGRAADEISDFIHRVSSDSLNAELVVAFEARDTDPIDIALDGDRLFVAARHLDGYADGDDGRIVSIQGGVVSDLYGDAVAPLSVALPAGNPGFASGVYCVNAKSVPVVAVDVDGVALPYAISSTRSITCAAFARGGAFGHGLYLGGNDGLVYIADSTGTVDPVTDTLGDPIQSLAFGTADGFGECMVALLASGLVLRIDGDGVVSPLLDQLLIQRIPGDFVRNDVEFSPDGITLFITDARRGVVHRVRASGVVQTVPPVTRLITNIPNPFNPQTNIRFNSATPDRHTLHIFDVGGRRVRALIDDQPLEAGIHDVTWDGRDDAGRMLSSGVYFAQLKTTDHRSTLQMVLAK